MYEKRIIELKNEIKEREKVKDYVSVKFLSEILKKIICKHNRQLINNINLN